MNKVTSTDGTWANCSRCGVAVGTGLTVAGVGVLCAGCYVIAKYPDRQASAPIPHSAFPLPHSPGLCRHCRWWVVWREQPAPIRAGLPQPHFGDCRRHAPTTAPADKPFLSKTKWPSTAHDAFCGDYVQRLGSAQAGKGMGAKE